MLLSLAVIAASSSAALLERQISAMRRMRDTTRAQYEAGMAMGHHDYLRAESEIAAMRAEQLALGDERRGASAPLSVLRGLADQDGVALVFALRRPIRALDLVLADAAQRPEIQAMQAMRESMAAARDLVKRMYLPMPMIGGFFRQRLGEDPSSIGGEIALTVPLFWFDRQNNELAMAEDVAAGRARGPGDGADDRERSACRARAGARSGSRADGDRTRGVAAYGRRSLSRRRLIAAAPVAFCRCSKRFCRFRTRGMTTSTSSPIAGRSRGTG